MDELHNINTTITKRIILITKHVNISVIALPIYFQQRKSQQK